MANVNKLQFELNGLPYIISVGQYICLAPAGATIGLGAVDDIASIVQIIKNGKGGNSAAQVCLEKQEDHEDWDEGKYLELEVSDLVRWFKIEHAGPMLVNRDYQFRNQNLKGIKCKILATLNEHYVIVELEKDVGGGSGDGIGKKGHCIPIKKEFLTISSQTEK